MELIRLDALDESDKVDERDELDELDALDESDEIDKIRVKLDWIRSDGDMDHSAVISRPGLLQRSGSRLSGWFEVLPAADFCQPRSQHVLESSSGCTALILQHPSTPITWLV